MEEHEDIDPMLTPSDAARLINVHINTIRRWANQGMLKVYRIGPRGDRRFLREDIINFLAKEIEATEGKEDQGLPAPSELGTTSTI